MSKPIDYQQREDALNPLRSICVTAPAGSGKTELLSQRVLTLLARVDQPEEILAITFTRKAAAEMHHRIMSALEFASAYGEPEEEHKKLTWQLATQVLAHDKKCGWQLLYNSNRLKIQTIDSLCASLTRQMPVVANFGAQPAITDNAVPYYKLAITQLLQQLETETQLADDLELLLQHTDNDWQKVEQLLVQLLQRRDQWIYHIYLRQHAEPRKLLESSLQVVITEHLQKLYDKLRVFSPEFVPLLDYAAHNLCLANSGSPVSTLQGITCLPDVNAYSLTQWQAIADFFLTAKGDYRKAITKKNGFPTETEQGDKAVAKAKKEAFSACCGLLREDASIATLLHELKYLPSANYSDQQWRVLQALTNILPRAVAELTLQFQQAGIVDHSHISMAALQALGDDLSPTEIMLKLDYQLKHILIDEFQDTASTQYELLKRLVEGWQQYNNNNPHSPNTLFIVGDGMQSIYGFRQANVGLFLEARKQGVNGLRLDAIPLSVNFRSSSIVVDWINHGFEQAFPAKENIARGAVKYEPSVPFNSSPDYSEVKSYALLGDDCQEREAEKVVELVQSCLTSRPDKSIAILVRTRNHLNQILPALAEENIEWQAVDIDALSSNGTVIDLLSLTKALLDKTDRLAWASLLRTPMIGLNNADLFVLLGSDRKTENLLVTLRERIVFEQLSRHGQARVTRLIDVVDAAFQQYARKGLRTWLSGIWHALGGPACVQSSAEYNNVDDYFSLLELHQQGGGFSLSLFEEAVSKLYAAPVVNDSPLQVMTIHKSKGLEFDTVILPGLSRRPLSDNKELLMWREYLGERGDNHLLLSPLSAATTDDEINQYLQYEASQTRQLENTRLLYVAATRAINNLYMTFTQDNVYEVESVKPPASQSLLQSLWPVVAEEASFVIEKQQQADQFAIDFDQLEREVLPRRIKSDWQQPVWSFSNPLSDYSFDERSQDEDNRPDFKEDLFPRQLGNIAHAILEHKAKFSSASTVTLDATVKMQWYERLLEREGVNPRHWEHAVATLNEMDRHVSNDEKGQWLLSMKHQHALSEYELLACSHYKGVERRIIDRTFIDTNNIRWIVDYKTSVPKPEEELDEFVRREVDEYKSQLLHYKTLVSSLNEDVQVIKTGLYFPMIPHWVEVHS